MYAMELYISGDDEDFLEAEEFFAASVMDPERSADEMKGGDVMVLKFFVKTDKDGNEINSWYYETWKRVKMPPVYPKDLVR